MENSQVKLLQLNPLRAAYVHSDGASPEEDALNKILSYAKEKGLTQKERLFGRNTYPTDQPEPHGYEYYLTVDDNTETSGEVSIAEIPGGLYAVAEVQSLFNLGEGWKSLFAWLQSNGYEAIGVKKGSHGWVNCAFEERVDWQLQKPPKEWLFRLWVQLKR
jgi:DNA gyrase inhibitor GyrI